MPNSKGVNYTYPEPYTGTNWLLKFIVENRVNYVFDSVVGVIGFVFCVAVLVGLILLCRKICFPGVKFAQSEQHYKDLAN